MNKFGADVLASIREMKAGRAASVTTFERVTMEKKKRTPPRKKNGQFRRRKK